MTENQKTTDEDKRKKRRVGIILGCVLAGGAVAIAAAIAVQCTRVKDPIKVSTLSVNATKATFQLTNLDKYVDSKNPKKLSYVIYSKNEPTKMLISGELPITNKQLSIAVGDAQGSKLSPNTEYTLVVTIDGVEVQKLPFKTKSKDEQPTFNLKNITFEDVNISDNKAKIKLTNNDFDHIKDKSLTIKITSLEASKPFEKSLDHKVSGKSFEVEFEELKYSTKYKISVLYEDKELATHTFTTLGLNTEKQIKEFKLNDIKFEDVNISETKATIKLTNEGFAHIKDKSLTIKITSLKDGVDLDKSKDVKVSGTSFDVNFDEFDLKANTKYKVSVLYEAKELSSHEFKTLAKSVDIKNAHEPKKAFLTVGKVLRELNTKYSKDTKPKWINKENEEETVRAKIIFEVEVEVNNKVQKQEVSVNSSLFATYNSTEKSVSLKSFYSVPAQASDQNNHQLPIKSYKLKQIEFGDDANKEIWTPNEPIVSDAKLDFNVPMVKDVIKENGKIYIEFLESIEGLSFNAQMLYKEVGGSEPTLFSRDYLPEENYEPRIVTRKGEKNNNILELSFKNIPEKIEHIRLLNLFVRNKERTYHYVFTTYGSNADKRDRITVDFKKIKEQGELKNKLINSETAIQQIEPKIINRDVYLTQKVDSRPSYITEDNKPQPLIIGAVQWGLKANKGDEELFSISNFPNTGVQGIAQYDSKSKEVKFYFNAQLPLKYTDPNDKKLKKIAEYRLDSVILVGGLKKDSKEHQLVQIPFNQSVKFDDQKDFNPAKLTHIQKIDNSIYLVFDKELDKASFDATFVKTSNGEITKENGKTSILDKNDFKVEFIAFEDDSSKNIVKVTLSKTDTESKLARFNIKMGDRTYIYDFLSNNELKDKLIFNPMSKKQ